jgi:hypothetical protein
MVFPKNFDLALSLYEDKFLQLKYKKLILTKQNFDEVMRKNFDFLAFICFYTIIKKELKEDLSKTISLIVKESYYDKFDKEISLKEMMTPVAYSYDLSDEPLFKTSILY